MSKLAEALARAGEISECVERNGYSCDSAGCCCMGHQWCSPNHAHNIDAKCPSVVIPLLVAGLEEVQAARRHEDDALCTLQKMTGSNNTENPWLGVTASVALLQMDLKRLQDERVAIQESDRVLTCVFCGVAYMPGTPASNHDALAAHVAVCEKHPAAAFRLRAEAAEQRERQAIARAEVAEGEVKRLADLCAYKQSNIEGMDALALKEMTALNAKLAQSEAEVARLRERLAIANENLEAAEAPCDNCEGGFYYLDGDQHVCQVCLPEPVVALLRSTGVLASAARPKGGDDGGE